MPGKAYRFISGKAKIVGSLMISILR